MSQTPIRYDRRYVPDSDTWQSVRRADGTWLGWVRRRPGRPHCDWQAVTREGLLVETRGVRIRTACEGAEVLDRIHDGRGRYVPPVCRIRYGHAVSEPTLEAA